MGVGGSRAGGPEGRGEVSKTWVGAENISSLIRLPALKMLLFSQKPGRDVLISASACAPYLSLSLSLYIYKYIYIYDRAICLFVVI